MNIDALPAARPTRPVVMPASGREHLATVLLGLWMTVGLFLDGYFHQNLDSDGESFLTPWHVAFYAGFTASALWLAGMSRRRAAGSVDWRLSFLPEGYEGARLGLLLFGLGGIGDVIWHTELGVERGIDALLSPTHLLLFAGLVLILTAPLRAARATPEPVIERWIATGSVASATALVGFFLNFAWGLGIAALTRVTYDPVTDAGETAVIAGVASMLVTTVVLFTAARVLLATGPVPGGALTVLFTLTTVLVSVAFDEDTEGVVAALLAGVVLDVAVRIRRTRTTDRSHVLAFGIAAAVLWLTYLGLLQALDGIEWQAEIWLGAATLSTLCAMVVAALTSTTHPRTRRPPVTDGRITTETVRQRYAELATAAAHGDTSCTPTERSVFGTSRYGTDDLDAIPATAAAASLGCGNPTAVADLAPGDIVLDLGSGGGIDVILSARRVGPTGWAYGLDMTDEMLELARTNAADAGITNVEFLKGHIESIPLPDATVDVVISNCVINLSTDKASVLSEAARVLRPRGRFAVSDVIADADMDDDTRRDVDQWIGCIAGALTRREYTDLLTQAGFTAIEILESHRVHEHAASAIIRATRPAVP